MTGLWATLMVAFVRSATRIGHEPWPHTGSAARQRAAVPTPVRPPDEPNEHEAARSSGTMPVRFAHHTTRCSEHCTAWQMPEHANNNNIKVSSHTAPLYCLTETRHTQLHCTAWQMLEHANNNKVSKHTVTHSYIVLSDKCRNMPTTKRWVSTRTNTYRHTDTYSQIILPDRTCHQQQQGE